VRYLIPVGSSDAALQTLGHLEAVASRGVKVEVVLLNVQPAFNRRASRFASPASRDRFRAERSRAALAGMAERLSRVGICFRSRTETGPLVERITAMAKAECADKILMGVAPQSRWLHWMLVPSLPQRVALRTDVPVVTVPNSGEALIENYLVRAGVAGIALLAGLLLAANQ
jgi:nucleotide-binding universal stress UspA family protein